jgi:hypothetical protein
MVLPLFCNRYASSAAILREDISCHEPRFIAALCKAFKIKHGYDPLRRRNFERSPVKDLTWIVRHGHADFLLKF